MMYSYCHSCKDFLRVVEKSNGTLIREKHGTCKAVKVGKLTSQFNWEPNWETLKGYDGVQGHDAN